MHDQQLRYRCECLCDFYFGRQDWWEELYNLLTYIIPYRAGHLPAGGGSRRRADMQAAAKHARGLKSYLQKIDLRILAEAMGPVRVEFPNAGSHDGALSGDQATNQMKGATKGAVRSLLPLRLAEIEAFAVKLDRISSALEAAATVVPVKRTRPPTPDPVVFAVTALCTLWQEANGGTLPSFSVNKGSFSDFCQEVLSSEVGFEKEAIRTAVRRVLDQLPEEADPGNK
jgi:hypothetical protein